MSFAPRPDKYAPSAPSAGRPGAHANAGSHPSSSSSISSSGGAARMAPRTGARAAALGPSAAGAQSGQVVAPNTAWMSSALRSSNSSNTTVNASGGNANKAAGSSKQSKRGHSSRHDDDENGGGIPTGLNILHPDFKASTANTSPFSLNNNNNNSGGAGGQQHQMPFTTTGANNSTMAGGITTSASTKHGICIDTLCKGYVNSFVDFFYLTHRTDQDTTRAEIPEAHLPQVQANLCSAERAHRRADSNRVLESYERLASYFQERGDYKTSVYFYEKCLDLSESTGNLAQQSIANNNLGVTHDALGDLPLAIRFHERHLALALQMNDDERVVYANKQLCDVGQRHADATMARGDAAAAVELYHKCLKSAFDSGDAKVEGVITHKLGVACAKVGDTAQALKWQLRYLEIAKQTHDQLAEAAAYSGIAEAYTALGDREQAGKHLAWCNELSARNQQPRQQAEACTLLGLNAANAGDHERAVAYFEKAYQIARGLNDQKLVDQTRIHLGVARGNVGMGVYMDVVNKDLPTLLRWKTRRVNF